jgi:hypothetical protein
VFEELSVLLLHRLVVCRANIAHRHLLLQCPISQPTRSHVATRYVPTLRSPAGGGKQRSVRRAPASAYRNIVWLCAVRRHYTSTDTLLARALFPQGTARNTRATTRYRACTEVSLVGGECPVFEERSAFYCIIVCQCRQAPI